MNILGIDIGTTTVTALIFNSESSEIIKSCTLKNDSFINGRSFERLQDTNIIIEAVKNAVSEACEKLTPDAVGVTGQMHGIVYLDKSCKPCSPLMIWQDERGNEIYKNGKTYAEYLTQLTGIKAASGFGLTTHFYNTVNCEVPENAVMLCTVHDYLVSLLTNKKPVTHSSDAASLGFYDLKNNCFDKDALKKADIDCAFLPEVIKETAFVGETDCDFLPEGIPVSVAIGDNQASFLGSVAHADSSVLVNVGTGSQISFATKSTVAPSCGEIRPLTDDRYIFVGSSLCGGRAYAILKSFFEQCADMLGGSKDNLYKVMDSLSENIFNIDNEITVNCEFCGTRENPKLRGSITDIDDKNFTPEKLICGFLKGVCNELYEMYEKAGKLLDFTPSTLVCSGNGLRKSAVWRKVFENKFGLPAELPKNSEEASVGACNFALEAYLRR